MLKIEFLVLLFNWRATGLEKKIQATEITQFNFMEGREA